MFEVFGRKFNTLEDGIEALKVSKADVVACLKKQTNGKVTASKAFTVFIESGMPTRNFIGFYTSGRRGYKTFRSVAVACYMVGLDYVMYWEFMLDRCWKDNSMFAWCRSTGDFIEAYKNYIGARKNHVKVDGVEYDSLLDACKAKGLNSSNALDRVNNLMKSGVVSYEKAIDLILYEKKNPEKFEVAGVEGRTLEEISVKMEIPMERFKDFKSKVDPEGKGNDFDILGELYCRVNPDKAPVWYRRPYLLVDAPSLYTDYEINTMPVEYFSSDLLHPFLVLGVDFGTPENACREFGVTGEERKVCLKKLKRYHQMVQSAEVSSKVASILMEGFEGTLDLDRFYILYRRRVANIGGKYISKILGHDRFIRRIEDLSVFMYNGRVCKLTDEVKYFIEKCDSTLQTNLILRAEEIYGKMKSGVDLNSSSSMNEDEVKYYMGTGMKRTSGGLWTTK